ncbi:MAG TPA: plastocyanin/azurin family copper-binding protein [Candidatus Thermoplasmatota archaeon]|nr:plastocyanin/azurin family copper-binding protein [Candidatus Thermoplasmatota archaeon]
MKAPLLLACLALLAATVAGCSAPSDYATPDQDADMRYVIHMAASGNRFVPAKAEVPVGSTVVWSNDGATPHNVVANDGSFTSDSEDPNFLQQGEEYAHTFNEPGTVHYQCHLHAGMDAVLKVTEA